MLLRPWACWYPSPAKGSNAAGAVGAKLAYEGGPSIGVDRGAQAGHQRKVIVQIVDRREPRAEDLVRALQMMQIAARELAACVARAGLIDRRGIAPVARVADLEIAIAREQPAVTRVAGRQDAIEHVDAHRHCLDQIFRR